MVYGALGSLCKRDATWEPTAHLTDWGADALVAEFKAKNREAT